MESLPDIPIPARIIALMHERNRLFAYPVEQLAAGIKATGFSCSRCGSCCTRAVNSHIFLLDHDVERLRAWDPDALVPAPDPEFCDQMGTLYVSGYAVKMKDDTSGSCWFLDGTRCRIYDRRFSACRIYPHVLRRNVAGHDRNESWITFIRQNEHGLYGTEIPCDECDRIAREVREYENAVLTRQIAFLETIHEYFVIHGLLYDPEMHCRQVHRLNRGMPVAIRVFHAGELEWWGTAVQEPEAGDPGSAATL